MSSVYLRCFLFQAKDWWKSCCEKEIPKSALCDILNKKYPTYFIQESKNCVDWKYVYKSWYQWSQIHNYAILYHVTPLNVYNNWLNVIKSSGKFFLIIFLFCYK